MYKLEDLKKLVKEKKLEKLSLLYGGDENFTNNAYKRLEEIIAEFEKVSDSKDVYIFSASGRTELSGNHTDHNNGKVIAGSINLDKLAIVSKRNDNKIVVYTDKKDNVETVDISTLDKKESEHHKSSSLIRGVCRAFSDRGLKVGGADIFISNRVLMGSGLSSSASFEALIGEIESVLYNNGSVDKTEIAIIGQYAENEYFGKPCGLMDQVGCSLGGIVTIDFEDNKKPKIEKIEYDFENAGYALMIVDTKGDHSGLTPEYAAVKNEMVSVALHFNKNVCREISYSDVVENITTLRKNVGDRAILRAFHFLTENERVVNQVKALKENNINEYLRLMNESGISSFMYLQNCYSNTNIKSMGVVLGLFMTKQFLNGKGACRIHGGGFAGTIQALIPKERTEEYTKYMDAIYGNGSTFRIRIRQLSVSAI